MSFLYFLEGLRNPALDAFFAAVTHAGEETLFIVFGMLLFWCVSKKHGYYLLLVSFAGTIINQFLKLWFRIPRPWVRDPSSPSLKARAPKRRATPSPAVTRRCP